MGVSDAFRGAGFSLRGLVLASAYLHRLKPVPLIIRSKYCARVPDLLP
jgi:hypothetical protein